MPDLIWEIADEEGVFLTFDDGPTPGVTEWILSTLDKYDAKATFFVLGKNVEMYPDLYRRILDAGHKVGNHTYSHQKGWGMSLERYTEDVDFANDLIHSELFRPPYARITPAQARLLGMLVRITGAASVIAVGTGSLVETLQLAHALDNKGLLTAVDSTAQGIALIRKAFAELQDETDTTLRAVNAPASVFLPRLNANDYDLIVVAGDAENYAATFAQASRLLRVHGVIVFTDVLALEDGQGGVINPADRSDKAIAMRELLTTVEDDEGFESTLTPDGTGLLIAYKK